MLTIRQDFTVRYSYPVIFTRDAFGAGAGALEQLFCSAPARSRVLTVIDSGMLNRNPDFLEGLRRFSRENRVHAEFLEPVVVRGGEGCKSDPQVTDAIQALVEWESLCRHSYILAIGGGAVLDAAGFVAATAHRGMRLVRMPTTTLAMNDVGVGVKNGINALGRKNFAGCFAPPFAVVNDLDFLRRLPQRELRCGIAEAVKVALVRDPGFFDWLHSRVFELALFAPQAMETMIIRCAKLHLEHIRTSGDPFESGSSRPLDLGHWSAHKLEDDTGGEIRHGEAVAIGIALDSLYSQRIGLVGMHEVGRIFAVLEGVGFRLYHEALGRMDLTQALKQFREHLGGELCIPLIGGIGSRCEVNEIDPELYRRCIDALARRELRMEGSDEQTYLGFNPAGCTGPLFSGEPCPAP